jgi:hypothetical protein
VRGAATETNAGNEPGFVWSRVFFDLVSTLQEEHPKSMRGFRTYVVLASITIFLIASRGMIAFNSPAFAEFDLHEYRLLAHAAPHLARDAQAPYAYRFLGPYIVGLLPMPDPQAFRLLNSIACLALILLFYRLLVNQGIRNNIAATAAILFACNRYFFGLFAWDPFQIDDVLALVCLTGCLLLLFSRRWLAYAFCFALGCFTREAVLILIPVSFVYLWEQGTLRKEFKKWLMATAVAVAVFAMIRVFVYADGARMSVSEILPYYRMKFGESAGNAFTVQAWFRRLIWCFMPFTLLPFVFWKTTRAFFSRRKFVLLYFMLVVITDFWGIDNGGGDAERQMAPAFLPFYWLIAEISQTDLLLPRWILPLLLAGGYLGSLHHLQGVYPLPSKRATFFVTLVSFAGIMVAGLWRLRNQGRTAFQSSETALPQGRMNLNEQIATLTGEDEQRMQ